VSGKNPGRAAVSKSLLGRCLLAVAILGGISLLPAALISAYVGYYMLAPRYAAVAYFGDLGFNLRLEFYLTDDEARDSGRYLSVISGGSYETRMLGGWDWAHRARTSIYLIDAAHIAVLSPLGYAYEITLKPVAFVPLVSDRSEQWHYLGAFDFVFPPGQKPRLQFLDARLPECVPMGGADPGSWRDQPRAQARRASCPTPAPQ
jgi:hypothetical protein